MSHSSVRIIGKLKTISVFFAIFLIITASFGTLTTNAASLSTTVSAELDGSDHYIDVPSSYGDWTVSENADWLNAVSMNNYRFVISVKANPTSSKRTATVTVNGSKTGYITVTQGPNSLTASASTKTFSAASGGTATISTKIGYGSIISKSCDANWLKLTGSGSSYKVTVQSENLTGTARYAKVTFRSEGMSTSITFTQNPYTLTLTPSSVSSETAGSEHDISVSAEYGSWSVSESCDWLTATKTGTHSFKIVTNPNINKSTRTATITVESGGTEKTITVTQKANNLTVTTTSNSFAAAGGTNTITAKPTVGTTNASSKSNWLTVTKSGNTYTVKATENLTGAPRTGVIAVTCGDITTPVTYTQNPHTLSLDLTEATDTAVGGTHTINVSSSYSGWKVTPDDSWLTAVKTGNYSFIITVEPNINSSSRKGTITVESAGVKETFTINQSGNSMEVKALSNTFAANGSAITVTAKLITGSASVEPEVDWITASKNGNTFSVKADENLTGAKRTGSIKVICGNMEEKITFSQEAHTLSINPDSTKINAKGTPSEISVSSSYNGWKVYSEDAWITPSKTGNYSFKIAAKPNTNGTIRTGTVTVESAGVFATVTVTQAANTMTVTSSVNSFLPGGGTAVIIAKPQTGTTYATTNSTWISIIKAGNTYTINANENLTGAPRKAVVAIHCGDITKTVTFTQNPYTLPVSVGSVSAAAVGSNHTISVPSAYGTWTVSEDYDWMNVTKISNYSFVISVNPNVDSLKRTGTVTLNTQAGIKTLDVVQAQNEMTVTVTSNSFDPDGIETNTIIANPLTGKTSFSTAAKWLKVTQKGNTFTVDATDNFDGIPRTGVVAIHCGNITKTVTFTQNSHTIKTDVTEVFMDGVTSTTTLGVVSTDANWTASDDRDWITANKTGIYSLLISVETNSDSSVRSGTVTLTACDGKTTCKVTVVQYGRKITIRLDPNGGILTANSTLKRYYGEPLGNIPTPDVPDERYVFAGWYTSADGGKIVTSDSKAGEYTTLYAHWTYSVLELNGPAHHVKYNDKGEDFLTTEYGSKISRCYVYTFTCEGDWPSLTPNQVGWCVPNAYTISVYCSEDWRVYTSAPWIKIYNPETKTEITSGPAGYHQLFIVVDKIKYTQANDSWDLIGTERTGSVSLVSSSGKTRSVVIKQLAPHETTISTSIFGASDFDNCIKSADITTAELNDPSYIGITESSFYKLGMHIHKYGSRYIITNTTAKNISTDTHSSLMLLSTDYAVFDLKTDRLGSNIVTNINIIKVHNISLEEIDCIFKSKDSSVPFSLRTYIGGHETSDVGKGFYTVGSFSDKLWKKVKIKGHHVGVGVYIFGKAVSFIDSGNAGLTGSDTLTDSLTTDIISDTIYTNDRYESATIMVNISKLKTRGDSVRISTYFDETEPPSLSIQLKVNGHYYTI